MNGGHRFPRFARVGCAPNVSMRWQVPENSPTGRSNVKQGEESFLALLSFLDRRDENLPDRVRERSDALDFERYHVAHIQELAAAHADARGGAGEDEVARIKRHVARELLDLLSDRED